MKELLFGTGGIPLSAEPRTTEDGIARIRGLGLGAMELEFVHSVNISKERAPSVKNAAEEGKVALTCHAPYYINLNSPDEGKLKASGERILQSARILKLCGGSSVAFHPGYYLKASKEEAFNAVKKALAEVAYQLKAENNKTWVRPETMGKAAQFGSLDEVLGLSEEVDQVMPCIDYSHLHAREGKNNSYDEFCKILDSVEKSLGKEGLENAHIQCQAVEYSEKGERRHLAFNDKKSDFKYVDVCRSWKDYGVKGVVIAESPVLEEDALLLKKTYENL